MKVCMLTWEYPPRNVGGISRHCDGLARALTRRGCGVYIITLDFPDAPKHEERDGVFISRVMPEVGNPNFLMWTLLYNRFFEGEVANLGRKVDFDVVHAHDWMTIPAGIGVKHLLNRSLVLTLHSTEHGRSRGVYTTDSYTIDCLERWGTIEATELITTSKAMRSEVSSHFKLPPEKINVIPNAINLQRFEINVDRDAVRRRFGIGLNDKLVLFVGRLTPQKGVEYLIQATPLIVQQHPESKFVIVGDGWQIDALRSIATSIGFGEKIMFTGYLTESAVVELMTSADVLVLPSVYEPFGMVALEGMAAGVPVVVSQIGGLAEVVEHEKTGVWTYPRNPKSIAWGVDHILSDPEFASQLVKNAKELVRREFSWESVAERTIKIYEKAIGG